MEAAVWTLIAMQAAAWFALRHEMHSGFDRLRTDLKAEIRGIAERLDRHIDQHQR